MPRLDIHPAARDEIREAAAWYAEHNPELGERFLAELDLAEANILQSPLTYPPYLWGTRKFLLHDFPYRVVYQEILGDVKVIAVTHGSRREGYWRGRL